MPSFPAFRHSTAGTMLMENRIFKAQENEINQETATISSQTRQSILEIDSPRSYFYQVASYMDEAIAHNDLVSTTLNQQFIVGSSILERLEDFVPRCTDFFVFTLEDEGAIAAMKYEAQSMLNMVQGQLMMTSVDGNYLFSGDKTDTAPMTMDLSALTTSDDHNVIAFGYAGSDSVVTVPVNEIFPGETVFMTSKATAFERTIKCLALAANGHFQNAHAVGQQAIKDVIDFDREIGENMKRLEDATPILEKMKDAATIAVSEQVALDLPQIAAGVQKLAMLREAASLSQSIYTKNRQMYAHLSQ